MDIILNGHKYQTDFETCRQLAEKLEFENPVIIQNGWQISDDSKLKNKDEIFIIEKGKYPEKNQLEAMLSARHTPKVHDKIKNAKVGIAGLGGLGSNIAANLARTGVGTLVLADYDIVEPSNLNRQNYFISHLGMLKTEATAQLIKQMNPYVNIEIHSEKITEENASKIFGNCSVVAEAFDNPEAKAMLVGTVLSECENTKIVCGSGMAGYSSSNKIKTRKVSDRLFICGDEKNSAKQGWGLMAPRVCICAGHQANMILRLLLGITDV